jgi:death on curing protein
MSPQEDRLSAWRWINRNALMRLHDMGIAQFGGAAGMRDEGLLESALSRAENLAFYGKPDLAELAAAYGYGLIKNHAFIDGNKRVAFLAVGLFLRLNGYKLTAAQPDATTTVLALAGGVLAEADFAAWIRANSAPLA